MASAGPCEASKVALQCSTSWAERQPSEVGQVVTVRWQETCGAWEAAKAGTYRSNPVPLSLPSAGQSARDCEVEGHKYRDSFHSRPRITRNGASSRSAVQSFPSSLLSSQKHRRWASVPFSPPAHDQQPLLWSLKLKNPEPSVYCAWPSHKTTYWRDWATLNLSLEDKIDHTKN